MKRALTLIEILVSTVILAVTVASLVSLFINSKRYIAITSSRMSSAELGRAFLDPFQDQVRQDTWDTGGNSLMIPLGSEFNDFDGATITRNGITFTPHYRVSRVRDSASVDTGMRRVVVNITWPPLNNP